MFPKNDCSDDGGRRVAISPCGRQDFGRNRFVTASATAGDDVCALFGPLLVPLAGASSADLAKGSEGVLNSGVGNPGRGGPTGGVDG